MKRVVVVRPFPGPEGKIFQIGEVVNTSGWRNVEALVEQRYIRAHRGEARSSADEVEEPFRPSSSLRMPPPKKKTKRLLVDVE